VGYDGIKEQVKSLATYAAQLALAGGKYKQKTNSALA